MKKLAFGVLLIASGLIFFNSVRRSEAADEPKNIDTKKLQNKKRASNDVPGGVSAPQDNDSSEKPAPTPSISPIVSAPKK